MERTIDSFTEENRFLSNYYASPITYEGVEYPTVEHAFQAAKTLDVETRKRIAAMNTPGEAKYMGRCVTLRKDWEQVKFSVMKELLELKFRSNTALALRLLATGDAYLIEGNTWNDTIWGVCNGKGQNNLGKLLMEVRSELDAENRTKI